jgi:hypothetical protein
MFVTVIISSFVEGILQILSKWIFIPRNLY